MHDAAEAYLGDMTSPVKRGLERFQVAETAWLMEIAAWRGLTWPMPAAIKDADAAILADEIRELTTPRAAVLAALGPGLGVEIQCWSPGLAAASFFERFSELTWPRRTA
jgi:hypothetical protein